jgi:hypothetical protein
LCYSSDFHAPHFSDMPKHGGYCICPGKLNSTCGGQIWSGQRPHSQEGGKHRRCTSVRLASEECPGVHSPIIRKKPQPVWYDARPAHHVESMRLSKSATTSTSCQAWGKPPSLTPIMSHLDIQFRTLLSPSRSRLKSSGRVATAIQLRWGPHSESDSGQGIALCGGGRAAHAFQLS